MLRSMCCCDRARLSRGWILGSSLTLIFAAFGLERAGVAGVYSQALIYAAFPMALLLSDSKLRRERAGSLLARLTLMYGVMLVVARLAEAI